MEPVNSLRTRDVYTFVVSKGTDLYIKTGLSAKKILADSKLPDDVKKQLIQECMSPDKAQKAAHYATTLTTPSAENFALILNHGYENAKCTIAAAI